MSKKTNIKKLRACSCQIFESENGLDMAIKKADSMINEGKHIISIVPTIGISYDGRPAYVVWHIIYTENNVMSPTML